MSTVSIKIPDNALSSPWNDNSKAPKDGRIIFIRDTYGNVDLAKWSDGEWSAEFGACDYPHDYALISIAC